MSTGMAMTKRTAASCTDRLASYWEMAKPKILVMELVVAAAAARVALPSGVEVRVILEALLGIALVAASASVANGLWERQSDALMPRTANRPLPTGRVSPLEALLLSALCLTLGLGWLLLRVNMLTAGLGLTTWSIYVLVYTPLKKRTPLNTAVGAVAGALPMLMGWTATGAALTWVAWVPVTVLFLWQFPHFMAIAWLYREDYRLAGQQMLSVVDPSGRRCGQQAVSGALLLLPVSMLPLSGSGSPQVYLAGTCCLGAVQLAMAIRFALARDETSARWLLRTTLLYLPAWLLLLVTTL